MDILSISPAGSVPGVLPETPADADRADGFAALVSDAEDAATSAHPRPKRPASEDQSDAAPSTSTPKDSAPLSKDGAAEPAAADAAAATPVAQTPPTPTAPIAPVGDAILAALEPTLAAAPLPAGPASTDATPATAASPATPAAAAPAAPATPTTAATPASLAAPTEASSTPAAASPVSATPATATASAPAQTAAKTAASATAETPSVSTSAPTAPAEQAPATTAAAAAARPSGQVTAQTAASAATTPEMLAAAASDAQPESPRADRVSKTTKANDGKIAPHGAAATADSNAAVQKPSAGAPDLTTFAKAASSVMAEKLAASTDDAAPAPLAVDSGRQPTADRPLDATDPTGVKRTETAQAPQAPERSAAARAHAIDIAQLATRFAARVAGGATKFSIRLDPPELGRVDVRLEIGADGAAHARLFAERPEALAELARNARGLERALADSGVDLSRGGLSFELAQRDGRDARERNGFADGAHHAVAGFERAEAAGEAAQTLAEIDTAYGFSVLRRGRLDVRI